MRILRHMLWIVLLTGIAESALATGTMRCATHVVDQGTSRDEVLRLCGPPIHRKDGDAYWYFDRGSSLLLTRVFFVGDQVEFIDDVRRDEM